MRCQVLRIAVGHRFEGEAAGDIDQSVELAEMRCDRIDGFLGRDSVGKVDAAEFDPLLRRRQLGCRVIDACNLGAPRQRHFRDHSAERSRSAGNHNDFSVHGELRARGEGSYYYDDGEFICNAGRFWTQ